MKRNVNMLRAKNVRMMKKPPIESPETNMKNCMTIHGNTFEYSKISLNYMFVANGTSITVLLLNFDLKTMLLPLILFATGVSFTISAALILYFRGISSIVSYIDDGDDAFKIWHSHKLNRISGFIIMHVPAITFFAGIVTSVLVYTGLWKPELRI